MQKPIDLTQLSNTELKELRDACIAELKARTPKKVFDFYFETTADRRFMPYVAQLKGLDSDNQFDRVFKELDRSYGGKRDVTVCGKYTAQAGEILEMRTSGSRRNDSRSYHLVDDYGEMIHLGSNDNSQLTAKIKRVLRNEIPLTDLISN